MNDLIKVEVNEANELIMSGRELHAFLEVETPYRLWFPRMCEYGFAEDADFTPYIFVHPQNKQEVTDHAIKIDMAKELCMIQRTDKGKECRQYFISIEEKWNSPEQIIARAMLVAGKMIETLKTTVERQEVQLIEQKPKVDFYDTVADSRDDMDMASAAKLIGSGSKRVFKTLREHHILNKDNIPYQRYINNGCFRVIEQKYTINDNVMINLKTLVLQKGLDLIRRICVNSNQDKNDKVVPVLS
jgi:anti-repressor protein